MTTAGGPGGDHQRLRLAVLDDTGVFAAALRAWVTDNAPDIEFVIAVRTWEKLVYSDRFPADLVVLAYPTAGPVSIAARARTCTAAGASVVVVVTDPAGEAARTVAATTAKAQVTWPADPAEVIAVARAIAHGAPADWRPLPTGAQPPERPKLSPSEQRALELYATGHSTPQVAAQMYVQYETAKTYLRRVREKYARVGRPASKKVDLVRRAVEDGIID